MVNNEPETKTGTIETLISQRGFGFIKDGKTYSNVFFHMSELRNCEFADLQPGDPVEFLIAEETRGQHQGKKKAIDISVR